MSLKKRLKIIFTISNKELIDYVRDWRTLLAVVLVPLLMFPTIFFVLPIVMQSELDERQSLNLEVLIETNQNSSEFEFLTLEFSDNLLNYSIIDLNTDVEFNDTSIIMKDIKNSKISSVLRLSYDSNSSIWNYYIIYDSTQESSGEAYLRISTALSKWEDNLTSERINDAGLNEEAILNPLQPEESIQGDIATAAEQAGFVFSFIIPLFVSIWTATSGVQPSIDITAGERERGTLESLLCAPCSRLELLLGKWLAVTCIVAVSIILQLAGLVFAISFIMSGNLLQPPELSLFSILLFLLAVSVFGIMVVALEMALAMRSRSVKEAGSILGPMMLFFFLPAIFAQFINLESIELFWFAVPAVNVLLAMRELLQNEIYLIHVFIWVFSSLIYAAAASWYASRQFLREDLVESLS
ncbi:MAG: ABC transporter permease protein NatB [Methanobacteriota archaeon]|nr:MAG: ABC transporter permease protein NatB [Euryarchaeota archaeon]